MGNSDIIGWIVFFAFVFGVLMGILLVTVTEERPQAVRQLSLKDLNAEEKYTFVSQGVLSGKPYLSLKDSNGIVKSYEVPSEKIPQGLVAGDIITKTKENKLVIVPKAKG